MTDWRPIKCKSCGGWHEQPLAVRQVDQCRHILEKCGLNRLIELRAWDVSQREQQLLADFPELSEKA